MFAQKTRCAVVVLTLVTMPASQANACEFLRRCFGGSPTTAYYAPVAAPACCPQPTVSYMPQTCFRTVYQQVPVVAYRPMTTCDPCTGCPRTVMSPVTSYVTQARMIPYTSYRPVVTANYAPACATGCAPVARAVAMPVTAAYVAPAAPVAVAAPAAPACCGGAAAPTTTFSPVTSAPYVQAAPAGTVGSTITSLAPAPAVAPLTTTTPSLAPESSPSLSSPTTEPSLGTPSLGTPQTFEKPATEAQPESRVTPPSMQPLQFTPSTTLGEPRSLDPEGAVDRMTARPIRQASLVRLASDVTPIAQYGDDAWQSTGK
jgi:hypothetical protein